MSNESEERRMRTQARLTAEWVPIDESLPLLPATGEITPRDHEAVVTRAMALVVVAVKGDGMPREQAVEVLGTKGLLLALTKPEQDAIAADELGERQRMQLAWSYEAAWTLMWAAGAVESLGASNALCDLERMITVIRDESVEDLLGRSGMRPLVELLDMLDLVEGYHRAVRQTMEDRGAPPPACHPDVVAERLHALRWLLVQTDAAWDEISLDT